jgi:zinc D-Ala-D-Ala dipeptidase
MTGQAHSRSRESALAAIAGGRTASDIAALVAEGVTRTDNGRWANLPIPDQTTKRQRRSGYRDHPIDAGDPAFTEPLVDLVRFGLAGRNHYAHAGNPPYWQAAPGAIDGLWARQGIAERLRAVDHGLAAAGLGLWVFDAWRPTAVQAYFHDVWTPAELRSRNPGWDEARIAEETLIYWAAPTTDPARPAPHATGAAVDVTLIRRENGRELWLGTVFDDPAAPSGRDWFEQAGNRSVGVSFTDDEALRNRRVLHWAMETAGLVGHPDEWWHFSLGDQFWARIISAPAAVYGMADDPRGKDA